MSHSIGTFDWTIPETMLCWDVAKLDPATKRAITFLSDSRSDSVSLSEPILTLAGFSMGLFELLRISKETLPVCLLLRVLNAKIRDIGCVVANLIFQKWLQNDENGASMIRNRTWDNRTKRRINHGTSLVSIADIPVANRRNHKELVAWLILLLYIKRIFYLVICKVSHYKL